MIIRTKNPLLGWKINISLMDMAVADIAVSMDDSRLYYMNGVYMCP